MSLFHVDLLGLNIVLEIILQTFLYGDMNLSLFLLPSTSVLILFGT